MQCKKCESELIPLGPNYDFFCPECTIINGKPAKEFLAERGGWDLNKIQKAIGKAEGEE